MKLIFVFVCGIGLLAGMGSTYGQTTKFTFDYRDITIKQVLLEIENNSKYAFMYNNEEVDVNRKVNIKVEDAEVFEVLDELFGTEKMDYKAISRYIIIKPINSTWSPNLLNRSLYQSRTVTGKVTDSADQPLPGVTIVVKGTTQGTVTNTDGEYTLSDLPDDATLVFSFVGMRKQEVVVGSQTKIDIRMEADVIGIEEVVAIGYGTMKKKELTGSVVTVDGDRIRESKTVNIANSLAGTMSGVTVSNRTGEPGMDDPVIRIRGKSTLGDNSILIIIDGIPRDGLGRLNPDDIETITVLKDATAAVYGVRSANGVMIIETKKGKVGKPTFNFKFDQGFQSDLRTPKMTDSYTFAQINNEIEVLNGRQPIFTEQELQLFKDGTDPWYPNMDWYDFITKDFTPQNRMSFSVNGGSNAFRYYFSFDRTSQDGHFKWGITNHEHYNLRTNIEADISKYLTVGLNVRGILSENHHPYVYNDIYPHIFLYHPTWFHTWPGTDYIAPCRGNDNLRNRVSDALGYRNTKNKGIQSTFTYDIKVPWIKGLSIDGTFNYDFDYDYYKIWYQPGYIYYYDKEKDIYEYARTGMYSNDPSLGASFTQDYSVILNTKINYSNSFNQHNISAFVAYEQMTSNNDYLYGYRSHFVSKKIEELFAGSSDKNFQNNDGSSQKYARLNYFGRLSYNYAGKYLAQFVFRYDGSQNFPKENRFGFFPGISVGWNISEESFMDNIDFITNLKLKASYGKMGNDNIPAYQYLTAYSYGGNYIINDGQVSGLSKMNVPNPNITWEESKTLNYGFEAFLWDALRFELNIFDSRRENILVARSAIIPSYTGLVLPDENIGIVDNNGIELDLFYANNLNEIKYSFSGNFSFARNKVIFSDEAPKAEEYQLATGRPMGARLLYNAIGIFSSQEEVDNYPHLPNTKPGDIIYEDANNDGVINSYDRIRINQTSDPEIIFGLTTTIEYKRINLSFLLQGQENANFYNGTNWTTSLAKGTGNYFQMRANDHWTPENTDATMPRSSETRNDNTQPSTHWLMDAGFLKLKNLEIGYTFTNNLTEKIKVQDLRIYASGHNLFLIYDHMKEWGYDPEATSPWYYPQQKIFNLGIEISF